LIPVDVAEIEGARTLGGASRGSQQRDMRIGEACGSRGTRTAIGERSH